MEEQPVGSSECVFNTGASRLKEELHAVLTEGCHVNLYPTCPPSSSYEKGQKSV